MNKIGIVYAISHSAGEYCKNTLIRSGFPFTDIITHECTKQDFKLASNNLDSIAKLLLTSIKHLVIHGAEIIIIAANSVHRSFDILKRNLKEENIEIMLLNIIDVTVDECLDRKYKSVAILGSNTTINSRMYQNKLIQHNIIIHALSDAEQKTVNELINFDDGNIDFEKIKNNVINILHRLFVEKCDSVIYACTELPLIMKSEDITINTLDTNSLLALAAFKKSALYSTH